MAKDNLHSGESLPPTAGNTITSFIFLCVFFSVGTAFGYGALKLELEDKLKALLPTAEPLALPLAACMFHVFVMQWLGFCVNNGSDQAFPEGPDPLAHHLARIGYLNDQHAVDAPGSATLSAVGLQNFLKFTKLCRREQPGERKLAGSPGDLHFHGFHGSTSRHSCSLVHQSAAFDCQWPGQLGVPQVEMPSTDLDVQTISKCGLQILQIGG